jgi:hypothetical protein
MRRSRSLPLVSFFLCAGLLAGCAGDRPLPPPDTETSGQYVPLTTPIIAVGDTQEHESTGFPLHDNDSAIDAYVEVAQRPPEQALFGRRLLEWALTANPDVPFIHLGDVMDLSCRSEADRIGRIFRAGTSPGVILPGNHDGLMFGIYAYNLYDIVQDTDARKWNEACQRGAHVEDGQFRGPNAALSKSGYISHYLENVAAHLHPEPGPTAAPTNRRHTMSWRSPNDNAFLAAVEGELFEGFGYADSFLIQRIQLPRAPQAPRNTIIIGLDTNQAGPLVSTWDTLMGRSPGEKGHIHPDQIKIVERWVDEAIQRNDIVIFAGHHNWRSLGVPTRLLLRAHMTRLNHPLVYLSAHTHTGFWTTHAIAGGRPVLELNVSSLSDWPLAYRRISFAYDETAQRILVRGELLPKTDEPVVADSDLLDAWKAQTCEKSGIPIGYLSDQDADMVNEQRASRGSMLEWLQSWLGGICETCQAPLYEHALSYQDQLLDALLQVDLDLDLVVQRLRFVDMPPFCGDKDYVACAGDLLAQQPANLEASKKLFRRKAQMVHLLNDHLDDLESHQVKTYMTCRAVNAAKIDYDAIFRGKGTYKGETRRRANHFFLTEASVGMK